MASKQLTDEIVEVAARRLDPEAWSMIDKHKHDDDWNGANAANLRHMAMTRTRAVLEEVLGLVNG